MRANKKKMKSYIWRLRAGKSKLTAKKCYLFSTYDRVLLFLLTFPSVFETEIYLLLEINMFPRRPPVGNFYRFEFRSFVFYWPR